MAETNVRWAVAKRLLDLIRVRTVGDAVTVSGDSTVTSATAAFADTDVGKPISGVGIPASTTIDEVTNATTVELSANATASATGVTIIIGDADLAAVQVEAGYPGDQSEPDCVWLDGIDGPLTIPVFSAGRKYRDDKFDIPIEIRVRPNGRTRDEVMERATEIAAAIEDVLANDPGLANADGNLGAEVTNERASCGEIKGEGWIAFAEVTVTVEARYE